MAKKNQRRVSKTQKAKAGMDRQDTVSASGAAVSTARPSASRLAEPTFTPDYSYVRNDLRRIGILAGSIFAVLIILAFVLPLILPVYTR